jgi:hypothetical protein
MIPQGDQVGNVTHERKDVDVIGLLFVAALILTLIALSFLGVSGVIHFMNAKRQQRRPPPMARPKVALFPEPRLEVTPGMALSKEVATQEVELESYGWIDRSKGIAHIPIAHAMDLLLHRGLPEVGAGQTRLQLMQARPQTDQQPKRPVTAHGPTGKP